ncbi:TPA: hypothetical protein N0F65_010738 [Lagenidium giganteum]|uniref:Guanylate-binding protein N-terminal domain-containing protein n=1 Tax=Lagenidium giganteum TaxID=4803 RepID=A0AAV2YRK7_9STRA|nr:TPA: hypothetical protein N0F65_010738 [Lagenidium giganteum]
MNSLKTMIFGPKAKAVKWLGMGQPDDEDGSESSDVMFVHPEASEQVLQPLGDQTINLISIFGAARQGKSFLMNLLADQQDLFKISNLREPCTQGVDLSGHFVPLDKFSALNGCPALKHDQNIQIGFVDAEGQGDRDITYDSRLVSPVLLASKVVLFNWKDSLQADRILNLLAVLARAAQGVELADGDDMKVFGHLHIVFRDWSFVNSTPEEVYNDLFAKERGRSAEVNLRNLARVNLVDAFESINIWLFPAPVANTANLRDKIRFDQLQKPFQEKLRELRKCLSNQLRKPMLFNRQPLTARLLSQIMPPLVETINSDQVIMPESIYSSMVRAEARAYKEECEKAISIICESQQAEPGLLSTEEFEQRLRQDIELIIGNTMQKMHAAPSNVRKEMETALRECEEKEIRIAVHANNEKIARQVSVYVGEVFENLKRGCAHIEKDMIPMKPKMLKKQCDDLLQRELARLEALPLGSQGKMAIDAEVHRINQHANILFEKLEVSNEKAVQKANAIITDLIRIAKGKMTQEVHANMEKRFHVKRPFTVATVQSELEDMYKDMIERIQNEAGDNSFISVDYVAELEGHKAHLAEEMNRRYLLEMRQILNEIGYAAREDLVKEVVTRLDGKLPIPEAQIKLAIDEAVQQVKVAVAKELQGWTILRSDISAKSVELERLGDAYTDEYLRKNQELQQRANAKIQEQQYQEVKADFIREFQKRIDELELPVATEELDNLFTQLMQTKATKFVATSPSTCTTTRAELCEKLSEDCRGLLDNQKTLNKLAQEKKNAIEAHAREREMREKELQAAREKEAQLNEFKSFVEQKVGQSESESRQLRERLDQEAAKAKLLMDQLEEMKLRASVMEAEKLEVEMQAKKEAERRKMAEDTARQAAEVAALSAEAMAAKEAQNRQLELLAREEAIRREEAESAARAAADAAMLSARAAIEAAGRDITPTRGVKFEEDVDMDTSDSASSGSRKRKLSATNNGKENSRSPASSDRRARTPAKSKSSPAHRRRSTGSAPKSSLAEARLQAQEEMKRRVDERLKELGSKKKK